MKATLGYRVRQDAPFVFNVEAQELAGRAIIADSLRSNSKLPIERWRMPGSGNRHSRIEPARGSKVSYQESLRLDRRTEEPDTISQRAGVRRDFAQLGIAVLRPWDFSAVCECVLPERPEFRAVWEAFLYGPAGPGWYVFDPTRMSASEGIVRIGIGRDAAQVTFCSRFGEMAFDEPEVNIAGVAGGAPATTQAVRTQQA